MSLGVTLPNEYTPLEYIEATGELWINTEYIFNNSLPIDIYFIASTKDSTGINLSLAGCGDSGWYGPIMLNFCNGAMEFGTNGWQAAGSYVVDTVNHYYAHVEANTLTYKLNHVTFLNSTHTYLNSTAPLTLFVHNTNSGINNQFYKGRLFNFKMLVGGLLVLNCIPAKRNSDGHIGIYELVNNSFLVNSGTSAFVEGPIANYVGLEYIQSTGTQWIDTRIPSSLFIPRIEADIMRNDTGKLRILFGVYDGASFYRYIHYTEPSNTLERAQFYDASILYPNINITTNHIKSITLDNATDGTKFIINGVEATGSYAPNVGASNAITYYLFGDNSNGTCIYQYPCKLWGFKVWSVDGIIRNFVPAKRSSDNVVGLYDKVNNIFYENSGSESFIAGTQVPNELSTAITAGQNVDILTESNPAILYNSHGKIGGVDLIVTTNDYQVPCEVVCTATELSSKLNTNNIGRAYKYLGPTTSEYSSSHTYVVEEYS